MAHSTNDWFAAIDPVANREFYGLEAKTEKQFSQIYKIGSDDEPVTSWAEYGGPASLTEKAENAAVSLKEIRQGPIKTKRAATWAGAMVISMEAAKDVQNRYARVVQSARSMGRAVDVTPELLTALQLDRAFNASYPETADALEICSTAHLLPDGVTTFSNELATPAALDETALEDVMTALRGMTGPDGNIMPLTIKSLVVPSALYPIAEKLRQSDKTLGSANNDPSVVSGKKVIGFDYLGSATRWFALTNCPNTSLFWDWIEKPQFITDQVPMNMQKVYVAFFRGRYGCKDPRGIYGSAAS